MNPFVSELLSNAIGGVVAAVAFAVITWCYGRGRRRNKAELAEIMGKVIIHRNIGERKEYNNREDWISKSDELEKKAIAKGFELSPTAGALIDLLDRIDPYVEGDKVDFFISLLSKVSERIRLILIYNL